MKDITIHIITENQKAFLPLLLLGDEQESQNLTTDQRYQRQGYASCLIEYIANHN